MINYKRLCLKTVITMYTSRVCVVLILFTNKITARYCLLIIVTCFEHLWVQLNSRLFQDTWGGIWNGMMEWKMEWNSEHTQLQLTRVTGTAQSRLNYLVYL